ncbi:MAG TPA: hypothetical protein VK147_05610 [Candidatus Didemnitutus sp.]|nr:hypothetical protein [Candidatus Didemnitutus sp.]
MNISKDVYKRLENDDFAGVLTGSGGSIIYDTLNGGGHDHYIAVMYLLEFAMDGHSAAASKGFEEVVLNCTAHGDLYNVSRLLVCYAVLSEGESSYKELDVNWSRVSSAVRDSYYNHGHKFDGDVSVLLSLIDIERLFCRHNQQ